TGREFAAVFLPEDRRVEARQALRAAAAVEPGAAEPFETGLDSGPDAARVRWKPLPLDPVEGGEPGVMLLAGEKLSAAATVEIGVDGAPQSTGEDSAEIEALRLQLDSARREAAEARAVAARATHPSDVA